MQHTLGPHRTSTPDAPMRRRIVSLTLALAVVGAACSDDGTTLTATSSTTAATATTAAPSTAAPATSAPATTEPPTTEPPTTTAATTSTEEPVADQVAATPEVQVVDVASRELSASRRSLLQPINGEPVERSWTILSSPDLEPDADVPILWAFHGAGGGGDRSRTTGSSRRLVDTRQAVAVLPNGHSDENPGAGQGFWNLGTEASSADDPQFIGWIMDDLATVDGIDLDRQFAFGFSNGSGFVNLLAKTSDYFDAVAPMFSQQLEKFGELEPIRATSVMQITGDDDRIIPNDGGDSFAGPFMSATESGANWARLLECGVPEVTEDDWAGTTMTITEYENCFDGQRVVVAVGAGLGHGFEGPANNTALEIVWEFFSAS